MFLPQGPACIKVFTPNGSVEQYLGSIVFSAKPGTRPAEFGKIARNQRHLRINTDAAAARSRMVAPDIINWAAQ